MTKLVINSAIDGASVSAINFSNLYYAIDSDFSPSIYRLYYGSGDFDEFRGHDFKINAYGEPTGGTVTQFKGHYGDSTVTFTGFSVAATAIGDVAKTFSTADDMRLIAKIFAGNDALIGGGGDDDLRAFSGNDRLKGGQGDDRLLGDGGDDWLSGSPGRDYLKGGAGSDTFVFDTWVALKNVDRISDFKRVDVIHLDSDIFGGAGSLGSLARKALQVGAEPHDASDRIIYDEATGKLFYDPDGTGPTEQAQFALLSNGLELAANDFFLVA